MILNGITSVNFLFILALIGVFINNIVEDNLLINNLFSAISKANL